MKKLFRLTNGFRVVMLAAAALAVYLPASNLPQEAVAAEQTPSQQVAQLQLPENLKLSGGQTSWQVFAPGY